MHNQYDPRGLITHWQKADGTQLHYTYNLRGLLTNLVAPDQSVQYDYDHAGRRIAMHDTTGVTDYRYNAASQPLTVTLATGEAIGYRYDGAGNRTHTIYPDGKTVMTTYTAANQPDHVFVSLRVPSWIVRNTQFILVKAMQPLRCALAQTRGFGFQNGAGLE